MYGGRFIVHHHYSAQLGHAIASVTCSPVCRVILGSAPGAFGNRVEVIRDEAFKLVLLIGPVDCIVAVSWATRTC